MRNATTLVWTIMAGLTISWLAGCRTEAAQSAARQSHSELERQTGRRRLRKVEPADNFIVNQEAWAKLWKAWRGQEAVPALDFKKQMVLVFTADGPNSVGCTPTADGKGNVRGDAMSTMIGGPGFGYLMLCISREGVKTVNGKPLPGVKVPPAKSPQGGSGSSPGSPGQPGVVPGSSGSSSGGQPGSSGAPIDRGPAQGL